MLGEYGENVLININNADYKTLTKKDVIENYLIRAVEIIDMTPVLDTLTIKHFPIVIDNKYRGDFGLSGMLILVESHISIHTFPELNYARVEISTCKAIKDIQDLIKFTKFYFGKDTIIDYKHLYWFDDKK